jgi:hypothetical protein
LAVHARLALLRDGGVNHPPRSEAVRVFPPEPTSATHALFPNPNAVFKLEIMIDTPHGQICNFKM